MVRWAKALPAKHDDLSGLSRTHPGKERTDSRVPYDLHQHAVACACIHSRVCVHTHTHTAIQSLAIGSHSTKNVPTRPKGDMA